VDGPDCMGGIADRPGDLVRHLLASASILCIGWRGSHEKGRSAACGQQLHTQHG